MNYKEREEAAFAALLIFCGIWCVPLAFLFLGQYFDNSMSNTFGSILLFMVSCSGLVFAGSISEFLFREKQPGSLYCLFLLVLGMSCFFCAYIYYITYAYASTELKGETGFENISRQISGGLLVAAEISITALSFCCFFSNRWPSIGDNDMDVRRVQPQKPIEQELELENKICDSDLHKAKTHAEIKTLEAETEHRVRQLQPKPERPEPVKDKTYEEEYSEALNAHKKRVRDLDMTLEESTIPFNEKVKLLKIKHRMKG